MAVGQRQVGQLGTAGFRHAQRVQREQAGQGVVVATGQPGLDQERAELGAVKTEPSRFLGDLRSAHMDRWRVLDQLFLNEVAVEPGDHDQLERDRCRSEATGLEVPGVQLDMGTADIFRRLQKVLFAPGEPEPYLGYVRLPGSRR